MTTAVRPQTGLKRLAGALALLCLVLFLLAIEQRQAVAAWRALRHDAVPAAGRVIDWARELPSGTADGLTGLRSAVTESDAPLTASPGPLALTGEYQPADEATRATVGGVAFVGARIRLENGEAFRTQPVRIAAGRDAFTAGQTFAQRLDAPAGAQIEVRSIVPDSRGSAIAPSPLCGGTSPGAIALLHRRDRVEMMVFRARTIVGPDAPATALCGAWSFRAR